MSVLITAMLALAEAPPADIDPTTGKGAEFGKAAPVGLLIILLMCVATFFLLRSMNNNMRKVPKTFDPATGATDQQASAPVTSGADSEAADPVVEVSDPVTERPSGPPA